MVMNVKEYDIDLHMKNHYRRIQSAKSIINNSLPVGYRTRYRYLTNKGCSRKAISLCSLVSKRSQSRPKYKSDSLISSPGPQTKRLDTCTPATSSRDSNRRESFTSLKNHSARDYVVDYVCSRRSTKNSPRQKFTPPQNVPVPTPRTSKYKRKESDELSNEGSLRTYQRKENDEKSKAVIQSEPTSRSSKCRPKESAQISKLAKLTEASKSSRCSQKENDTTSKESSSAETTPRKSKKSQHTGTSGRSCSQKSQTTMIRDSEYDQFTCRIVEDILRNQPIFWKTAQQIFNSHFEANRNRLNEDLMKEHIQKISDMLKLQVRSESSDICDCNYTSNSICNKIKRKLLEQSPAVNEPTSVTGKDIPKDVLSEEVVEGKQFAVQENETKHCLDNLLSTTTNVVFAEEVNLNINEGPSTNETTTEPENATAAEEQNINEADISNVAADVKQENFDIELILKDADEKEKDTQENLITSDEKTSGSLQMKRTSEPALLENPQLEENENLEQAQISEVETHSPMKFEETTEISDEVKILDKAQQTSIIETVHITPTPSPIIPVSPTCENIVESSAVEEVKEDVDKIIENTFEEINSLENENHESIPVICGASMFEAHVKTHDYDPECKKTVSQQEMLVKCEYIEKQPQSFSTPLSKMEILKNKNFTSTAAQTSFTVEKSFFLPSDEELEKFKNPDFISTFKKFSEAHINILQNCITPRTCDISPEQRLDIIGDSETDIEGVRECEPCLRERTEKVLELLPLCTIQKKSTTHKKRKVNKKTKFIQSIPIAQSSSSDYSDISQSKVICVKKMKASQTTQTDFEYDLCSDELGSYVY